jgi:hypothetical protein
VMAITASAAMNAMTAANIETVNVNFAAGTPTAVFTNFSGLDTVNVAGTVAGTVTDATDAGATSVSITDMTRVITINDSTGLGGTTTTADAETLSVTVSGLSHGSTTATQSGITLTAANTGANETLEVLNITSAGTVANDFTLNAADVDVTLATVNLLGDVDLTARILHAGVTGITVVGTANTATTDVIIDRNGATTTATNVSTFAGIDTISMVDSTSPAVGGDGATLSGLKSGQTVKIMDDHNASTLGFSGVTGASDSATVILDNETAATDLDIASIDIQNVETLTIQSSGIAASVSTTAENLIDDLTGDATTITVSGDSSLNLDLNIDAPASGSRVVTVNASTNTAFVDMVAAANTSVSYSLTGTAGADILTLNASGGTLAGGAGADALTGGTGADTMDGGAGIDTFTMSTGADTLTGGAGNDIYDINADGGVTVVVQVSTSADLDSGKTSVAADDDVVAVVNGISYRMDILTNGDTGNDIAVDFVTEHATAMLAATGVTLTSTGVVTGVGKLLFTGAADGTAFTARTFYDDNAVRVAQAVAATTTAVTGVTQTATITDFAVGDSIDTAGLTLVGTEYYEGAIASATAGTVYGAIVITDVGYANFGDAENAVQAVLGTGTEDALMIFYNTTLGYAEAYFDTNTSADNDVVASDNMIDLTGITSLTELAATMSSASFTL